VATYNAALNRPSFQSSTYNTGSMYFSAHLANDGSLARTLVLNNIPKCAHSKNESNPWWAVDLGRPLTVFRVDFTNVIGMKKSSVFQIYRLLSRHNVSISYVYLY